MHVDLSKSQCQEWRCSFELAVVTGSYFSGLEQDIFATLPDSHCHHCHPQGCKELGQGIHQSVTANLSLSIHWIGFKGKTTGHPPIFHGKIHGFLQTCPQTNPSKHTKQWHCKLSAPTAVLPNQKKDILLDRTGHAHGSWCNISSMIILGLGHIFIVFHGYLEVN